MWYSESWPTLWTRSRLSPIMRVHGITLEGKENNTQESLISSIVIAFLIISFRKPLLSHTYIHLKWNARLINLVPLLCKELSVIKANCTERIRLLISYLYHNIQ
jgi:hypothetical protein